MTIEKLLKVNRNLTDLEKEIANYIMQNKAAILRLCKKINISGFKELKVKLAQEISVTKQDVDVNFPFNEEDDPIQIANKIT